MQFCEKNELELLEVYSDPGKSGRSTEGRDDFLEMIKVLKPYNFIVVYELSRFSRNLKDIVNHFENLVKVKHCVFICLNPEIDSRRDGAELLLHIMGTVAQQESDRTSKRVTANMNRLKKEGKLMCRPPFGYIHDPITRKYLEDEEQQNVVREMELLFGRKKEFL